MQKYVFTTGLTLVISGFGALSAQGAVIFKDDFNSETLGRNASLSNWIVSNGTIDVIGDGFFDFLPGNGRYLDLDGSSGNAGKITTNKTFSFNSGDVITLEFDLAGNQQGSGSDSVDVSFSLGSLFSETFILDGTTPLTTFTRTINVSSATNTQLIFDHAGGDNGGFLSPLSSLG